MSDSEDSGYESSIPIDPINWPHAMQNNVPEPIVPETVQSYTFKMFCEQISQFCLDIIAIFCLFINLDQFNMYSKCYRYL